jgi:hypothetical protein
MDNDGEGRIVIEKSGTLELSRACRLAAYSPPMSSTQEWEPTVPTQETLSDAVVEWEGAFGALTEAEIADAERTLDRASRRSGAA